MTALTSEKMVVALTELVTAAEQTMKEYKEEMEDWSYAEYDGRKYRLEELAPDLCAAVEKAKELLGERSVT